jgi:hypothetical protein
MSYAGRNGNHNQRRPDMADRVVLVQYDNHGEMIGTVYHNISCLESGWVNGAMHGRAPIQGHFRATLFGRLPPTLKPCSYCGG